MSNQSKKAAVSTANRRRYWFSVQSELKGGMQLVQPIGEDIGSLSNQSEKAVVSTANRRRYCVLCPIRA